MTVPPEKTAGRTRGRLLVAQGLTLCGGGLLGVRGAASWGGKGSGGLYRWDTPIIPGWGTWYLNMVIRAGIGHARNAIVVGSSDALSASAVRTVYPQGSDRDEDR